MMDERNSLDLISIHVVKCGGVSLRTAIQNAYGAETVLLDYGGPISPPADTILAKQNWFDLSQISCIHGVFHLDRWQHIRRAATVTLLRDPISRLISQYFYLKNYYSMENYMVNAIKKGDVDLLAFAKEESGGGLYTKVAFRDVDMRRFDLIGDFRDMNMFYNRLAALTGRGITNVKSNLNPEKDYQRKVSEILSDSRLVGELRALLRFEIDFYEHWAGRSRICSSGDVRAIRSATETAATAKAISEEMTTSMLRHGAYRAAAHGYWDRLQSIVMDYLCRIGLESSHTFLDVGCGPFRHGRVLVEYLGEKRYYAVEKDQRIVDDGYGAEIEGNGLGGKFPRNHVAVSSDFSLPWADVVFDVILAHMIFHDLGWAMLSTCLDKIGASTREGSLFVFSAAVVPEGHDGMSPIVSRNGYLSFPNQPPFHFRAADIEGLARSRGWALVSVEDYGQWAFQMVLLRRVKSVDDAESPNAR